MIIRKKFYTPKFRVLHLRRVLTVTYFVHIILSFTTAMNSYAHMHISVITFIALYFWIKLNMKMPKFLIIQKPDVRHFSVTGFAVALKPSEPIDGTFYKRWHSKMILWLTTMNCYHIAQGKPEQFTPKEERIFDVVDNMFRGAMIDDLTNKNIDSYLTCTFAKELWNALGEKFGVSDAGSEMYLMEQLFYYKMVENRSVVEQTQEIHVLAKELK
jgi:hypothetical protein